MRCSAADRERKLLDRIVSSACFLTGGLLECDYTHLRSVAVLYMLHKIRYNPMHSIFTLSVLHVPVQVTHGVLVAHLYSDAGPLLSVSME